MTFKHLNTASRCHHKLHKDGITILGVTTQRLIKTRRLFRIRKLYTRILLFDYSNIRYDDKESYFLNIHVRINNVETQSTNVLQIW